MKKRVLMFWYIIVVAAVVLTSGCGSSGDSLVDEQIQEETYQDSDFNATDWSEATHSKNVDPNFDEVFVDTEVKRLDLVVSADRWQSMLDNMTEIYGDLGVNTQDTPPQGFAPLPMQEQESVSILRVTQACKQVGRVGF